jgi:hypothetical protein
MEHRRAITALALAAGVLTLGGGCLTADKDKAQAKKPDVTQPGVLPAPQDLMKRTSAEPPPGEVVQAGGVQSTPTSTPPAAVAHASGTAIGAPSLSKLTARFEKKVPATEMAVAWRNRIAYLPDPSRNGVQGPGVVGQLFLYGGPKLQFADADGTLTVDLIDDSPPKPGRKPATPERWQFSKEMLKNLRAMDETFGMSYVLFLPWPAYKPDVTRVRISARYDPDNGNTLYARESVITIDATPHGTPVWDGATTSTPITPLAPGAGGWKPAQPPFGAVPNSPQPGAPIPLGGPPTGGANLPPISVPLKTSSGVAPSLPPGPMPLGAAPIAPPMPEGLAPIAITLGK